MNVLLTTLSSAHTDNQALFHTLDFDITYYKMYF